MQSTNPQMRANHYIVFLHRQIWFASPLQVCKDVRSDIESSSEEEADASTDALKTSQAPKGENGTNGYCTAAKTRALNHSGWWPWTPPTSAASVHSRMLANCQWTLQHVLWGAPEQHIRCKDVKKNWRREPFEWLVFWPMGFSFCQMLLSFDFLSIWSDKLDCHSWTFEMSHLQMKAGIVTFISSSDGTCCELDHKIKNWNVGSIFFIVHCEFLLIALLVLLFFHLFWDQMFIK